MFDRARDQVRKTTRYLREDTATVVSMDSTGGYRLAWRGAIVGPVWSVNGLKYASLTVVKVMTDGVKVIEIIP